MQRPSLFMLLLLIAVRSHALQVPPPPRQLQPQPQADGEQATPPVRRSPPKAAVSKPVPVTPAARPVQPAAPGRGFRPTEKIRADSAVSFPVDI